MFLKKSLEKKLESSITHLVNSNSENNILAMQNSYIHKAYERHINESNNDKRLNYPRDYKRFSEETVKPEARIAKQYVKQLRDLDILELYPKKRWNNSTKPNDKNFKTELSKTLFEVSNGLSDVNIVKLKSKQIEMGTDSRNVYYVGWNNSTMLEEEEKKRIDLDSLEKAYRNTAKSWYDITEKNKMFGGTGTTFFPRKTNTNFNMTTHNNFYSPNNKNNSINYNMSQIDNNNFNNTATNFNMTNFSNLKNYPQKFTYRSPTKVIEEKNNIIRRVKLENEEKKEKMKKDAQYEFPAASKEKISAIVFKRMNSTFDNELGKTMSKPWRKHKGIFNSNVSSSFRNTQNTFKTNTNIPNMQSTLYSNFSVGKNKGLGENKNNNKFNEEGINNHFNITGFSNVPFNKTHGTTDKGFFPSAFTTGQSFFNATKATGMSDFNNSNSYFHSNNHNSKNTYSHNVFIPLPSKKKDYYPKNKWMEENWHHPGKWVSIFINKFFYIDSI